MNVTVKSQDKSWHVRIRETNASEPLIKHRKILNDIKTGVFEVSRDKHEKCPTYWSCGIRRCIGGVNRRAFVQMAKPQKSKEKLQLGWI
ncbi:MAG: hypothetical protein KGZ96_01425 [Clostridia bacterium]|nr:hypothetical protein [Clostridia bacterium]